MDAERLKISQIKVNLANPRTITDAKFTKLVNSVLVFPKMLEIRPIVVDETFVALGGNMRLRALTAIEGMSVDELAERLTGIKEFERKTEAEKQQLVEFWGQWLDNPTAPVIKASELTDEESKAFVIKDNVGFGDWDMDALANEWEAEDLDEWGLDVWQNDNTAGGDNGNDKGEEKHAKLTDKFIAPPFSILDTRQGYWQERKAMWRERIADNGESREGTLGVNYIAKINNGVSLLDPVMAEIVCKWFGVSGGTAFDCFAGDTVFGYVAATLGMSFTGVELREEQAKLNNERVAGLDARYICDDGQNVAKHIEKETQDLLFSCPPYFDLEVYSDLENDASNQGSYEDFIKILNNAFTSAISCLKNNRFAVIVVGDIRNKQGYYYDFIGDIKSIFKAQGMPLYNELILIEPSGTLSQRVQCYMRNRKVGKCHQNVLVFYKGNVKEIPNNFPVIDFDPQEIEELAGGDNEDKSNSI